MELFKKLDLSFFEKNRPNTAKDSLKNIESFKCLMKKKF